MAKETLYQQCKLVHPGQNKHQTSWIPSQFAVVGKVLKLKNDDDEWEDGWVVESAGTRRLTNDQLPSWSQVVRAHRRATGDSLPKVQK
jgi:hypothetical protein